MAIWQAKARTTKSGLQLDPAERISIDAALKVQAMGSAYAGFQEKSIGSLEKGKCADMVVWDRDISSLSEDGIKDIKAMMTFLNGKIVYERKDETG